MNELRPQSAKQVNLVLARLPDAAPVAELSRELIETGLPWSWDPARVSRAVRCPDTVVLTARLSDKVVGFAIMHFDLEHACLHLLAVDRKYQRAGIGRRLMEWLEESARTAGIAAISLEVRAKNQAARAFYRSLGFSSDSFLALYYCGREAGIRMVRQLRTPTDVTASSRP